MLVQVRKGSQITIPSKIRKAMGIKEGDMLEVDVKDSEIFLKPMREKKIELRAINLKEFSNLKGIVSIGGDAVKEADSMYD